MRRYLFVVARDKPELFAHLLRSCAGMDEVEVILDKRVEQRRRSAGPPPGRERRLADRRLRAKVEEDIRNFGWSFVRAD